jgi:hypothetical protein
MRLSFQHVAKAAYAVNRLVLVGVPNRSASRPTGSLDLSAILAAVKAGSVSIDAATSSIHALSSQEKSASLEEMTEIISDYARIDHGRMKRTGLPEVIYAEGKTDDQIRAIFLSMHREATRVGGVARVVGMATRLSQPVFDTIAADVPSLQYYKAARIAALRYEDAAASESSAPSATHLAPEEALPYVAVLCAGTSDLPVAEEAAVTLELMGVKVQRLYDVGVAGLHRLLNQMPVVRGAAVTIVAAGMDGALPSVVGGLAKCPVVAVPTSVGYGAAFGGVAPLLTMLNSCAPGVSVVNIDNGFGAAMVAVKVLGVNK